MQEIKYKPLTLPKVKWEKNSLSDNFGELIAQPLEPGFGITLGNAIRRIILSSVEGSAVTSVIIKGVNNEFSTIKGVIEDTLHVLLNIKGIVVKNKTGEPGKMRLKRLLGVNRARGTQNGKIQKALAGNCKHKIPGKRRRNGLMGSL